MPAQHFEPGRICFLDIRVENNTDSTIFAARAYVLLELPTGDLWFAPSWCHWPEAEDYYLQDLPTGHLVFRVIPLFIWPPSGTGSGEGIFWGGITDPSGDFLISTLDSWSFTYREEA